MSFSVSVRGYSLRAFYFRRVRDIRQLDIYDYIDEISDDLMWVYINDLESKFDKIDHTKYALAYSGGKDSHRIYHLIKNVFRFYDIEIVGINTYMEHPQIRDRIYRNSDKVLLPLMQPFEVKEKYGSPCFTKAHDEMIGRYQKGLRSKALMDYINRNNQMFKLTKQANRLVVSGELHKVSNKCCDYLKKKPMQKYLKSVGKTSIIGYIRGESKVRDKKVTGCFNLDGQFQPTWDMPPAFARKIDKYFNIEIPSIYNHIDRTGCMGCPYGCNSRRCNSVKELSLIESMSARKYITELHKESYKVLGIYDEIKRRIQNENR